MIVLPDDYFYFGRPDRTYDSEWKIIPETTEILTYTSQPGRRGIETAVRFKLLLVEKKNDR